MHISAITPRILDTGGYETLAICTVSVRSIISGRYLSDLRFFLLSAL